MQAKTTVGTGALLLGLAGGTTALATTQATPPDPHVLTAPAPDPSSSGINTTARGQMPAGYPGVEELASFRREPQVRDAVPENLAEGPLLGDGVGDVSRARRAQVSASRPAWIMPGRKDSICIVSAAALNCAPASVVENDGVAPSVFKTADGPFRVMGIAADDVQTVDVTLASGVTRTAAVVGNAYLVESETHPVSVRWLHRGQAHSFEFPSDMFELPTGG